MKLNGLLSTLQRIPAYRQLLEAGSDAPLGLLRSARPFLAAGLATDRPGPLLVVTGSSEQAQQWVEGIGHFLPSEEEGGPPVLIFPEPDSLPFERIPWTDRTRQARLTALAALQSKTGPSPVVVAPIRALLQMTIPPRELRLSLRGLAVGALIRLDETLTRWVQAGYEPAEVVEEPGTFARRGGLVDIWPPNLPYPVRIDLFGDEVESLRVFDPNTQRTERKVQRIEIGPGSEALSKYGDRVTGWQGDKVTDGSSSPSPIPLLADPNLLLAIRDEISNEMDLLAQGHSFRGIEWYLPLFYAQPASLLDHLPANATLLIDDGTDITARLREADERVQQLRYELARSGELPAGFPSSFFSGAEMLAAIQARKPLLLGFGDLAGHADSDASLLARTFVPGARFGGKTKEIVEALRANLKDGDQVVLLTRQAARIQHDLAGASLPSDLRADLSSPPGPGVTIVQSVLAEGFVIRASDDKSPIPNPQSPIPTLLLLTDAELFGWQSGGQRKQSKRRSSVAPELFFADVKAGDFVVHMEHGIGQYEGLAKLELGGVEREYLQVNYAQSDKLYVPVHQADRLSRYVGAGDSGIPPAITRLGTADWQTVKDRAKKAVEEIAEDLLVLYAERALVSGHAFGVDTAWQEEMEAAFPFQETEDQIQAIAEVKRDMESEEPMDRIIIGDVGYGKTEVAVRAAFKAVMDGKQVAVLVPTTVLAQQHHRTFSRRLAQFPVSVEMLSRFRTSAQQTKILQGIREGKVDIVVGTHRLLSKDLDFHDLGLLVVDEEQRFGVSHKEKLKQLRTQVDVLTLSATPIPRTLHMSLSGVRDMSTITTPPQERLPVRTILSEYDDNLVKQAIQREIDREGQIFLVHNRVQGIEQIAARVRRLVPSARVEVAHGQMAERGLEDVMMRFADGEIDVLISTTIVENGLDIRRANTMIINRADHFGLAQLYQLRGRVGRGAVRGYCYLLYEKYKSLSFDSRRRLEALMESSEELGAGFRIAMRDLEIRGAGELLGARQHGQIASIGFDLYTRLLAQAVNELRRKKSQFEKAEARGGETTKPQSHKEDGELSLDPETVRNSQLATRNTQTAASLPFDLDDPLAPAVTLDLPLLAEIPAEYVTEEGLRLQLYRRIAGLNSRVEIDGMRQELLDRFGPDEERDGLPMPVENLLYQILIKILALKAGILNIGRRREQIAIRKEGLSDAQRRNLQARLRRDLGHINDEGEFISQDGLHVGREAVYLPIDEDDFWRVLLVRALEALRVEEV
ncbi:MAG: transcription-repair coupling factor [Caldilineaceae bacterium]|nr:transcription-repair coupling factor [Caldilineaceae bacterium]